MIGYAGENTQTQSPECILGGLTNFITDSSVLDDKSIHLQEKRDFYLGLNAKAAAKEMFHLSLGGTLHGKR